MAISLGGIRDGAYFFGIERVCDHYVVFVTRNKVKLEAFAVDNFSQAEKKLTELIQQYKPYFN